MPILCNTVRKVSIADLTYQYEYLTQYTKVIFKPDTYFELTKLKTSKYLYKEKRGQFITELTPNKFLECQVITVRKPQLSG